MEHDEERVQNYERALHENKQDLLSPAAQWAPGLLSIAGLVMLLLGEHFAVGVVLVIIITFNIGGIYDRHLRIKRAIKGTRIT